MARKKVVSKTRKSNSYELVENSDLEKLMFEYLMTFKMFKLC